MKRLRDFTISVVYWLLCGCGRWCRRLLGRPNPGQCIVLCYHSIKPGERQAFHRQMDELERVAILVSADETRGLRPGIRYAAVTFDDAFTDVVNVTLPGLAARGIPSTVFVPSGWIGGPAGWYQHASSRDRNETVATLDELRNLPALVAVGSHGMLHKDLCNLDEDELEYELIASREHLERELRREVTTIAFPYGRYTPSVLERSRRAGYRRVFVGDARASRMSEDEFVTGRVHVDPSDWMCEFWLKIRGAYCWRPALSAWKRALYRLAGALSSGKGRSDAVSTS